MKRILSILIIAIFCTGACVAPVAPQGAPPGEGEGASEAVDDLLGEITARGTIRISTDPNYAPQSFLDESGNFVGFDVDVAKGDRPGAWALKWSSSRRTGT